MKVYIAEDAARLAKSSEGTILDIAQPEVIKLHARLLQMFPDDFTISVHQEKELGHHISVMVANATKETVAHHILHNASFLSNFFIDLEDNNRPLAAGSKVVVEYTTGNLKTNSLKFRAITKPLPEALKALGDWFEKNKEAILAIKKH